MQRPVRGHWMRSRAILASRDTSVPRTRVQSQLRLQSTREVRPARFGREVRPGLPHRGGSPDPQRSPGETRILRSGFPVARAPGRPEPCVLRGPAAQSGAIARAFLGDEFMIDFAEARQMMVEGQVRTYDVTDP